MFQKTILTTFVLSCVLCLKLGAQSMVIEVKNGNSITENLVSIQNLKFPNKNMVLRKTDNSTRSINLLSIEKLYFNKESVNSINSNKDEKVITIYPNPSPGIIKIDNAPVQKTSISVYGINGIKMLQTFISSGNNEVNVSHFEAGMYFIKINSQTIKFIKF
jgi:hypothetical protein